jgi:hypothetical protein
MLRFVGSILFFLFGPLLSIAIAQTDPGEPTSRAETLRRERETKQKVAEPYEQNAAERAMHLAEKRIVPLLNRDGVYARLGSLTTGSGFAYGTGYRDRSLVSGRGRVDLWAAASLKRYWSLELRGAYPLTPDERVTLEAYARRFAYPQEEYFGTGPAASRADQVAFDLRGELAGAEVAASLGRHLSVGGGVEYLRPTAGPAESDSLRSAETVFGPDDVPGFGIPQTFVRTLAHVTYDYRQPINARRGGWYRLDLGRYHDRRDAASSFTRVDVELRQFVSFLAERRIVAGRVRWSTTDVGADGRIPFYLLPSLGGNDTLRGFRAHRFRGPHALLLQGEYRWEVWSGFDAALFVDAGKVALRRADLDLRDLERDYGIGFRFNTDNGVIARVDAAFGSRDGKHLHVVFGGTF